MFKKYLSSLVLLPILFFSTSGWAEPTRFTAKKVISFSSDDMLLNPVLEYIVNHQGQIYTVLNSGLVKHWNDSKQEWEDLMQGLTSLTLMLFSDGKDLYVTSQNGVYRYNFKDKIWEVTGKLSESLMSAGISTSGGKLTVMSGRYGIYALNAEGMWEKLHSKNTPPPSYEMWGMSDEMIVTSSGKKIFAFSHEAQEWKDITGSLEQKIKDPSQMADLIVFGKIFYVGLKNGGVLSRTLEDADWKPLNDGIGVGEKILHFSAPHEETRVYTSKNQYQLNPQGNAWVPMNLGLEKVNGVFFVALRGKQVFFTTRSAIYLKQKNDLKTIHGGLETGVSFSKFAKSDDTFWLASPVGLTAYDSNGERQETTEFDTTDFSRFTYAVLPALGKIWLGTHRNGVYAKQSENTLVPYNKGIRLLNDSSGTAEEHEQMHDAVFHLLTFQNKIYAISLQDVYELNSKNEWKIVFRLNENNKKKGSEEGVGYGLSNICCATVGNGALYLGTMNGLYRFDGNGPFKKVLVGDRSENTPAYHVASSDEALALQVGDSSVYRYRFNDKGWENLSGEISGIQKLLFHEGELFAITKTRVYQWSEEFKDWENLKDISARRLMGEKPKKSDELSASPAKIFYDLMSDQSHLYVLASDGIFEILEDLK